MTAPALTPHELPARPELPALRGLPDGRVPAAAARRMLLACSGLVLVGLVLAGAAWLLEPQRFAFAYLVGFLALITTGVGALALLLLQHLTRAGWSSAARRQLEWISGVLVLGVVLFIPVALLGPQIYEWMRPEAQHDALIHAKSAYLNRPAFAARAGIFLSLWGLLAYVFARVSRRQDSSERPVVETAWMQRWSAPGVLLVGLSLTFASFDWLMSLDPHWYSTIFGIYVISGSLVAALAALAMLTIAFERRGLYGPVSTVEHRHDIGKLLFGFTCFWAYIGFCQFFLIWYAGIPEETIFFQRRWVGSWKAISLLLAIGHFALPFVVLIARTTKRSRPVLFASALFLFCMHLVDLGWLVLPTRDPAGLRLGWIDLAGLWLPLSLIALFVAFRAAREPLYPIRDPRLDEAVGLENP